MCNLYSITTNQAAIIALSASSTIRRQPRADAGRFSGLSGSSGARNTDTGRELTTMRWWASSGHA
jgi:hypothetical protein